MNSIFPAVRHLSEHLETVTSHPYPWREDSEPFLVLVAEMMLVRTRADLVIDVYKDFTTLYPTAVDLANASEKDVTALLTPLGLRKRIPFFKQAAQYICDHYPNGLPEDRNLLERIPGIGRYTSEAVLAFAFDVAIVPADVNVFRLISRVTGLPVGHKSKGSKEVKSVLPELVPLGGRKGYKLLDFTRNTCRSRKPQCSDCPILQFCEFGRATE